MDKKLLQIKNFKKHFKTKEGMLHAVDDISIGIEKKSTLGLVGESGCGKSTFGKSIVGIHEPTGGQIIYDNRNIIKNNKLEKKEMLNKIQIVFQDPHSSLNPRLDVANLIADPLYANNIYKNKSQVFNKVKEVMELVGLEQRVFNSYPHELDGGRRQRVGIARALVLDPEFIVLDEPTSALDVSVQAQILNLLNELQEELDLTYLFISHDLSVVRYVSDKIAVMYLGKIIEISDYESLFKNPKHPYTQALISAIPIAKTNVKRNRIILEGGVPDPINPSSGCRFYGRCRYRKDKCKDETPDLLEISEDRYVACHFTNNLSV